MAEPGAFLVVALSGRALALAVRRSGRRALVLDLFGDSDMRASAEASMVVRGDFDSGFDPADLLAAAQWLAPASSPPRFGFAYGAGLESRPSLVADLAEGRRLYGNRPDVVGRIKNPRAFFPLLARLGIPFPEISFMPPADPAGWLVKRIGGSGGSHVEPLAPGKAPAGGCYFQRRAEGRPIGLSFIADGRRAFLLGVSEQWSSPAPGSDAYRFGGVLQPAELTPEVAAAVSALLDVLVRELGLVGLNSLDLIVDGRDIQVLEVNPRPGANLDIFDGGDPAGLFGLHVAACEGRLPQRWTAPRTATAMSVLYADRSLLVPPQIVWPAWVVDRPAPGARIGVGAPICTVLAAEASRDAVRKAIAARTAFVFSQLHPAEDSPASAVG